ncbi:MAG: RNA-binding S4 domain-containing protein [Alphaproteobacteria bacterium]|nr:MAG: RNA-binding S4 domain-containing protein [Alphaproteobacteria bacterium]
MSEDAPGAGLRVDKWLWYARFFKSRTLAAAMCNAGRLRLGGVVVSKAHHRVRPGDVLTFPQGRHVRVIRVVALASRRGPAVEARLLYEDLAPPRPETRLPVSDGRPAGSGRPTKRDRRALDRLRQIP